MKTLAARSARVIAGLWAGVLLCIAAIATPAPFALLAQADAGRVAGRMLAQEAYLSLAVAVLLLLVERVRARQAAQEGTGSVFSPNIVMILATLFCTVAGYFAVQPMMAAARLGQGPWSFGALHAVSGGLFAIKGVLALALAWRLSA